EQKRLDEDKEVIRFEKQDLPFAKPLDKIEVSSGIGRSVYPVYGVRSVIEATRAEIGSKYADGSPAITSTLRGAGKGGAVYFSFLPGLSYFAPAMPKRPMDRGASDESMTHFLPVAFDPDVAALIKGTTHGVHRPVQCSTHRLVET